MNSLKKKINIWTLFRAQKNWGKRMKMNFPSQHGTLERCKTLSLSRKSLNILCILVWKCEFCHHFIINPKKHPENKSKVWKGLKKLLFCILHLSQLSFSSSHRTQKRTLHLFYVENHVRWREEWSLFKYLKL